MVAERHSALTTVTYCAMYEALQNIGLYGETKETEDRSYVIRSSRYKQRAFDFRSGIL